MNRRINGWLAAVLLGAFAACADGGGTPVMDLWTDGSSDAAPDADVPPGDADLPPADADIPDADIPDADVPDADVPPPAPVLDFVFVTATGAKGGGLDSVDLQASDEPAAYAGQPGLQLDVQVTATGLEAGREVVLLVAGNRVGTVLSAAGSGDAVIATFPAVTLTHDTDGYEVRAEATNAAGLTGQALKTVRVDTGACGVALTPTNEACVLADADPDTAGLQVVFTVTNPDRTCTTARIEVTANGTTTAAGPVALDASGAASLTVTLLESADGVDGVAVDVVAEVSDAAAPDRTGRTSALSYTADLVDPAVTVAEPSKAVLTLADDRDGDPLNGLTFDAAGTATGAGAGLAVTVALNGVEAGSAVPDASGLWRVRDLAATVDGSYTVSATARDACGREGRGEHAFVARVSRASLAIVSPAVGAVLLARDDGDPATPLAYETTLVVQGDAVTAGTTLAARCREDRFGSPFVAVGSLAVDAVAPDGLYPVPVTVPVQTLTARVRCAVRDDAPNPGASDEVPFTAALPAPWLKVLQPAAGARVKASSLPVVLGAQNLDGVVPAVRVLAAADGAEVLSFTPAKAIAAGGLAFALPLEIGGVPVADGDYVLDVAATDAFGNRAADTPASVPQAPFSLDTTAPVVAITQPAADVLDPALNPGDADADPATPGHQATVVVTVLSGGGAGTKVCLAVNGDRHCTVPADGETAASFAGITLVPGANDLQASATDAAGNAGPVATRTVTLNLPGPRVRITTPAQNGPVAAVPFDLVVRVTDAADVPQAGAPVTVAVNGTDAYSGTTGAAGTATFPVPTLSEAGDTFVARATVDAVEGASAPRVLSLKTAVPILAFRVPANQDVVNLAYGACTPGEAPCRLDVLLDATSFEDGSLGTLSVACPTTVVPYGGAVEGSTLRFPNVVLADQSACTLSARATDAANRTAEAGPIQVRVDRKAPRLIAFQSPDPNQQNLTFFNDQDPATPGIQYAFQVILGGAEAGRAVTVSYGPLGQDPATLSVVLDAAVPDNATKVVSFPQVTLPDGLLSLAASVSDLAGNPATLARTLNVVSNRPLVRLVLPAYVDDQACASSATCGAGVCAGGTCAIPWAAATNRAVTVSYSDLPEGTDNLRLCASGAGLSGTPCTTTGYRQVAVASAGGTGNAVLAAAGLPDGSRSLVAEALLVAGQPWTTSLDAPNAAEQVRHVFQDTVAPAVTALESPSDTEAPAGTLNIAEQKAAGRVYALRVAASEPGTLVLSVNGVAGAPDAAFDGDATYDATLREGGNEIRAEVRDLVGNPSPLPPSPAVVYYRPTVDTQAPALSFRNPAGATLKAGGSRDVVLASDAVGLPVSLRDGGTPHGTAVVDADGLATFPYAADPVLTDGPHDLQATVADAAGNPATATRSVTVDMVLPGVTLASPLDGATLTDADDARPGSPGFQVEVSFGSPSDDAADWQVWLARNCDAAFVTCDPPALLAQGSITNAGGLEPSLFPTLPAASTPWYRVLAVVVDGVGNPQSASADITVNLTSCQVSVAGIGDGAYIANQACPVAGTDCAQAALAVTVTVGTACGAVDTVRLVQTGKAAQDLPLSGQSAVFATTVDDATAVTFEARALEAGGQVGSSGALPRTVDLKDPATAFTTPAAGTSNPWGVKADGGPAAGLQQVLTVAVSDVNLAGGALQSLSFAGTAVAPSNVALPLALGAGPVAQDLAVTLPDLQAGAVVVTARDAAGNEATSSFDAVVDLQPPATPALATPAGADLNRRRPAVTLRWDAVGDDGTGGGAAAAYQVRFSPLPIATDADFEAACDVAGLAYTGAVPTPASPGTAEAFTVTGPDVRDPAHTENGTPCHLALGTNPGSTNYAFAIRAVDDVGNTSPVAAAGVVDLDLSLRHARFSGSGAPYADASFQRRVTALGDLDGDGLGDFALGGNGASTANTFCIVYGHGTGADRVVGDLAIDSASGTDHQCLSGGTGFGMPPAEAGDLNGDGADDLAVGESSTTAPVVKVFLGVPGGRLASTPNITLTGAVHASGGPTTPALAGRLDFDGDGLGDLLVGSYGESKAYLVPGRGTWGATTSLAINLQDATSRSDNGVVTFVMTGGTSTTRFGVRAAAVRDLDGDGKDEAAVATQDVPSQVLVFQGRSLAGGSQVSVAVGSGGPDDATVLRLAPDLATASGNFGQSLSALQDLDGDGLAEVVASQPAASAQDDPKRTVTIFRGGYLAGRWGQTVQVLATAGTGTRVFQNERGLTLHGSFDKGVAVGNLDDDPGGTSNDLAYIVFVSASAPTRGKVFLRLNVSDPSGAFGYGTMPWEAPVLVDPLDPAGTRFGYFAAVPLGDFNGDGFPDLLVGTDAAGYAMVLY